VSKIIKAKVFHIAIISTDQSLTAMSMWGGGIKPPKPPSVAPPIGLAPPSSNGKKYANERQSELEALRQRGLARLLNKHFTTVTKAISEERAAAEAALADLEARKANTSEFTSSNSSLTYYQHLYRELQEKKAALKRKERETLLLYQRYVDKFASTGVVVVPDSRDMKIGIPPSPTKPKPTTSYVPVKRSPSVKIAEITEEIEDKVNKNVSLGGDKLPSAHFLGIETTLQSKRALEERGNSEFSMRLLEAKGVDVVASPRPESKKILSTSQFGIQIAPDASQLGIPVAPDSAQSSIPVDPKGVSTMAAVAKASSDSQATTPSLLETFAEDIDDLSNVSGLTSSASQVLSEAEERLIEFLKTETEAIRKIIDAKENESELIDSEMDFDSQGLSSIVRTESALAAEKAEVMLNQMQRILADHETSREVDRKKAFEPYPLETPNPSERWLVCWDDTHQREYYFESKMGLTQWEKPNTEYDDYVQIADYTKSSNNISALMDVTPGFLQTRMSRRDIYRYEQRQRRKRQTFISLMLVAAFSLVTYYIYMRHQSDPIFAEDFSRRLVEPSYRFINRTLGIERILEIHHVIQKTIVNFGPNPVSEDTKRLIRDEAERSIRAEYEAREKERIALLEAERKAKEERAKTAELQKLEAKLEESQRKERERLEREHAIKEETKRKELERKLREDVAREEMERRVKAEAKEKAAKRKVLNEKIRREKEAARRNAIEERKKMALVRPWQCNFPLAYILSRRCRKLSVDRPIFDLRSFVDAIMQ
jgi:hypothetical protein